MEEEQQQQQQQLESEDWCYQSINLDAEHDGVSRSEIESTNYSQHNPSPRRYALNMRVASSWMSSSSTSTSTSSSALDNDSFQQLNL